MNCFKIYTARIKKCPKMAEKITPKIAQIMFMLLNFLPVLGEVRPRVVLGLDVHRGVEEVELSPRVGHLGFGLLVVQAVHEVRVEDLAHEVEGVPIIYLHVTSLLLMLIFRGYFSGSLGVFTF